MFRHSRRNFFLQKQVYKQQKPLYKHWKVLSERKGKRSKHYEQRVRKAGPWSTT